MMVHSADDIAKVVSNLPAKLIGIDGYPRSGKSTLARSLSMKLRVPVVHLDDFVERHKGSYVNCIRLEELAHALEGKSSTIIEGVCLLQILDKLGLKPDILIYAEARADASPIAIGAELLLAEIVRYHNRFRPKNNADLTYSYEGRPNNRPAESYTSNRDMLDIAYINAKAKVAIVLACGGMLAAIIGLIVLLWGITGGDKAVLKAPGVDVSASGIGGVIMMTSAIWGYLAYKARPIFAHRQQVYERIDPETNVLERHHSSEATYMIIMPKHGAPPQKSGSSGFNIKT